jgi:hypothetical protein
MWVWALGRCHSVIFFFNKRNWEKNGKNCFSSVNWTNFANFVGKFTNFSISQDWKKIKS